MLVLIAMLLCTLITSLFVKNGYGWELPAMFGAGSLFIIVTWVGVYYALRAQDRIAAGMLDDKTIDVMLDDDGLQWKAAQSYRRFPWGKISHRRETKDFIALYNEKLRLLLLPKDAFTPEALADLRSKVPSGSK